MRRALALLLPLLAGCFATDTRGALCKQDAQCGPGFQCQKDGLAKTGRCGVAPSCPDHGLALGDVVFDYPADYARKASCVLCDETEDEPIGEAAQDVAYEITAEIEGRHIFRTLGEGDAQGHPGSSFRTVLYGYLGSGCEDKPEVVFDVHSYVEGGVNESLIAPYLLEGETFTVVVDGDTREPEEGERVDDVEGEPFFGLTSETLSGQCGDAVVTAAEAHMTVDATGAGNTVLSSCGAPLSEDYTLGFTASERGLYSFRAGSDNAVVALRSGLQCQALDGTELACDRQVVEQFLDVDTALTVVVDGATREGPGGFELDVDRCAKYTPPTQPAEAPAPDETAEEQVVTVLTIEEPTLASLPQFAPGCRPPDASEEPAVAAWLFTAVESGRFRFDTSGSPEATRLAVRAGLTCAGSDRACVNVVDAPEDVIDLDLMSGETIVLVVETLGGPSDYRLEIQRVFS